MIIIINICTCHTVIPSSLSFMFMLSQQEAKELDNWLMSPAGGAYTLQQLMELAGLTIALVIVKYYPNKKNIFIATGPGNNGGDGIVAARHLSIFNYSVTVYRPSKLEKPDSDFFKVRKKATILSYLCTRTVLSH